MYVANCTSVPWKTKSSKLAILLAIDIGEFAVRGMAVLVCTIVEVSSPL